MQPETYKSVIAHAGRKVSLSDQQIRELLSEFDEAWQQYDEDVAVDVEHGQKCDEISANGYEPRYSCEAERRAHLYQEG